MIRRILAVLAILAAALAVGSTPVRADDFPVRILVVGDSMVTDGLMQAELSRLLGLSGIEADIHTEAVVGTDCYYWTSRIGGLLALYAPELVIYSCGTNDDPALTIWGEPRTSWSTRVLIETARDYPGHAKVAFNLVQYSDLFGPAVAQAAVPRENQVNNQIYSQFWRYSSSTLAVVDWQYIPATATYLDSGGIHRTARGQAYAAREVYATARTMMEWPTHPDPITCDRNGHWRDYSRPTGGAAAPCLS